MLEPVVVNLDSDDNSLTGTASENEIEIVSLCNEIVKFIYLLRICCQHMYTCNHKQMHIHMRQGLDLG